MTTMQRYLPTLYAISTAAPEAMCMFAFLLYAGVIA